VPTEISLEVKPVELITNTSSAFALMLKTPWSSDAVPTFEFLIFIVAKELRHLVVDNLACNYFGLR
jgi:hypothetical protein